MDAERPWIEVLRDGRETADLLRVYEALKIQPQEVDNILNIHSLNPESLESHYRFYRTLMYGHSPLSRPERETLAVAVSVRNECHY
ncbi:MAG: peroxidase [Candidatus Latescibacterota bacterium]|nr:MAG: peroxidase [Candidatus Latescibacterota bacterium]